MSREATTSLIFDSNGGVTRIETRDGVTRIAARSENEGEAIVETVVGVYRLAGRTIRKLAELSRQSLENLDLRRFNDIEGRVKDPCTRQGLF